MQKQLIFATIFLSIFGNFKAQMAVTEIEALKNKPSSLPILIEETELVKAEEESKNLK